MAGNYFAALLRASGLPPPLAPSSGAEASPPPVDGGIVELHDLHEEQAAQPAPRPTAEQPAAPTAPVPTPVIEARVGRATEQGARDVPAPAATRPAAPDPVPAPAGHASGRVDSARQPPAIEPPRLSARKPASAAPPADAAPPVFREPAEASRQALLRVALRWVGSGPRDAEPAAPALPEAGVTTASVDGETAAPRERDGPPVAMRAAPVPAHPSTLPERPDVDTQRAATLPWRERRAVRPAAPHETVQVTIGAIHLRVDAPPPPVQAVAAVAPPAVRPPARVRGDLERRLLRRL